VPATELLEELLEACAPHAAALGCERELEPVRALAKRTGAQRQLELARSGDRLHGLVKTLAEAFGDEGYPGQDGTRSASSGSGAPGQPGRPG
jgi:gamma-glutamyl:cysteine ligase YbdK (ATP-grasp superfamily)